jgi:pyrroloquinoline quinone biosynthesis protein E
MSLEDFEIVLSKLNKLQVVTLYGLGEPLLNPNFVDMVRIAKTKVKWVNTISNGTLLNREIANGLIDAGLNVMTFSIDGATPETYEFIRRGAEFQSVIENISYMNELKLKRGSSFPKLNMNYILTNQNYHQLPDLINLSSRIGIERINVSALYGGDTLTDVEDLSLDGQDATAVDSYFAKAQNLAKKMDITLVLPPLKRVYHAPICDWPWRRIYITWNGYVSPCCVMCFPEIYNMGNLLDQDLWDIWNGPAYQHLRGQLRKGMPSFFCDGCPYDIGWITDLGSKTAR